MKPHEMIIYGICFFGSILVFIWLLVSVFCTLLGGGK